MSELFLLVAGIVVAVAQHRRIARLERAIAELRGRQRDAPPIPQPVEEPTPPVAAKEAPREPAVMSPEAPPRARAAIGFETLVGGKLPIWIGGIALVLAGFFLVRYSIDNGLLGPAARTLIAAVFSAVLVATGEATRRHPLTRDDRRVAQALAGAAVASAYGTLYIAAAQYHLIGAAVAFVLMLGVTAAALALALRHGPPTAIMALVGGFTAPLAAGFDAAGLGPLLAYLALFIAALFGLAARRGWTWLALAAVAAGFAWANLLVWLLDGRQAGAVAGFVGALAIGATLALPRTGGRTAVLRNAPLIAGLLQLLVLAPVLEFGALAWIFYLVLAAAALLLAWRDAAMLPGALIAAVLVVVLLGVAFAIHGARVEAIAAALVAAALFAIAGTWLSRRDPRWAITALLGIAGPVLAAHLGEAMMLSRIGWAAIEVLLAAAAAAIAWRHHDRAGQRDAGLIGGSAVAALLGGSALVGAAGSTIGAAAMIPVVAFAAIWAARIDDPLLGRLATLTFAATVLLGAETWLGIGHAALAALGGAVLTWPLLPAARDAVVDLALPAITIFALLVWRGASLGPAGRWVAVASGVLVSGAGYVLAKNVLAIGDMARFTAFGFVERAAITLAFMGVAVVCLRRPRTAGAAPWLAGFAVARVFAFDLILANPAFLPQQVGAIPLLNAAVVLPALMALGAWRIARTPPWRTAMLGLSALAAAAAVRQAAHGTILTGAIGGNETWGYSAALLLLALAWLWRGIAGGARDLRLAALALITLVTLKVFLLDIAALGGLLRIAAFLGLGVALIGIGWAYGRVMRTPSPSDSSDAAASATSSGGAAVSHTP